MAPSASVFATPIIEAVTSHISNKAPRHGAFPEFNFVYQLTRKTEIQADRSAGGDGGDIGGRGACGDSDPHAGDRSHFYAERKHLW